MQLFLFFYRILTYVVHKHVIVTSSVVTGIIGIQTRRNLRYMGYLGKKLMGYVIVTKICTLQT